MPDWKKIKAEYIKGGTSYRKLCAKYGVSFSALKRLAIREKWTDLREQAEHRANTKLIESVSTREAEKADAIQTIADVLLSKITEGIQDGSLIQNSSSIRQLTASIKDLRDIKGMKSELDKAEQIARIEKLKREANIEKDEEQGQYGVVLMPEIMNG